MILELLTVTQTETGRIMEPIFFRCGAYFAKLNLCYKILFVNCVKGIVKVYRVENFFDLIGICCRY